MLYRQITDDADRLAGVRGDAGAARLRARGQFDLVVLDTPPTANALDFLDAPDRIAAAVSSPALKWFCAPGREGEPLFVSAPALRRRAAGAAAGQAGGQPLPGRPGRVPGRFPGRAGRFPRARRGDRSSAAWARRRLPAGAGARGGRGRRGAVLPCAAASGGDPAGRLRRQPRAARAGARRRGRDRGRAQPHAGLRGASDADARRRRRASWRRSRAVSATLQRRSGESSRDWRARAPGIAVTEVPRLDHGADSLAELRVVGEHLSARRACRPCSALPIARGQRTL